ncbi:MAG: hypothetical protein MJZ38_05020 [archaeon]|nr:hypothetical protein [archaeon]
MADIALIRITEYEGGSVNTIADAFSSRAKENGHSVIEVETQFSKSCHCGGHCCQRGGEGCGDDDCVCTFARSVPGCDVVVLAFAVDMGFTPTALNRILHKVTFNCERAEPGSEKRILVLATSDSFNELVFNDALSVIRMECNLKNWTYAGELLIPGLPDACLGADPVSCRQSARLADRV